MDRIGPELLVGNQQDLLRNPHRKRASSQDLAGAAYKCICHFCIRVIKSAKTPCGVTAIVKHATVPENKSYESRSTMQRPCCRPVMLRCIGCPRRSPGLLLQNTFLQGTCICRFVLTRPARRTPSTKRLVEPHTVNHERRPFQRSACEDRRSSSTFPHRT